MPSKHLTAGDCAGWIEHGLFNSAHHCGIFSRTHEIAVNRGNRGRIIVAQHKGRELSGWGMGHVMWQDNRQGYIWNGQEIEPTDFEVCEVLRWDAIDEREILRF